MPAIQGLGNCQYTALTTAGTTTINQANLGTITPAGVFYGMLQLAAGTTFAATFYDIYQVGTTTSTATLLSGTGTAGQSFAPSPVGVGVRYRGSLVVVTSGTPGAINALWD